MLSVHLGAFSQTMQVSDAISALQKSDVPHSAQHGTSTPLCNNSKFQTPRNGLSRAPAPTILKLRQILSNGRPQVAPTDLFGIVCSAAKSLRSVLGDLFGSAMPIPHSSLLTETLYSSSFNTDINASCGTDTDPSCLIRFFPSFCFSNSFFFLVISPP